MPYPQITDYQDSVQDPRTAFSDPELKLGQVKVNPLGLPEPMSGGFVLTYTVKTGSKQYAVRCFHREVPNAEMRYSKISSKLRALGNPYFVNFDFQPKGVLVQGRFYPIVKMDWAAGETLGLYLDRWSSSAPAIAALRQSFVSLADYLERNGVAHGDIQNENVIVSGSAPRLIDYDGMWVSGMPEGKGSEAGHKHFQHPGRTENQFGPKMDRFSFIVIDVSLQALAADASLHKKYREGGQAIIFKANDFADPSSSPVFQTLQGIPALRDSAKKLAAVCAAPILSIPTLSDFIAGRNIPTAAPAIGAALKVSAPASYIGAFQVVDAKSFNAVVARVGDKIELVGKIVSVKQGMGKRGRGRGKPWLFVNFGPWNGESAKITIWSEGLAVISDPPSEAWVGKWVSVTGLVEPPYEGKHHGKPYKNVGITVTANNQIIRITEADARFRLGGKGGTAAKVTGQTRNADILTQLHGGTIQNPTAPPPTRKPAATTFPKTRNEQILTGLQTKPAASPSHGASGQHRYVTSPAQRGFLSRVPGWVWFLIVAGIVLRFMVMKK
jgi:hypothetical protein